MKKCLILAVIVTAFLACNDNRDSERDRDNNNMNDTTQTLPPDSNVSYPADTNRVDPSFPR